MQVIDWIILLAYVALVVGLGCWFVRKSSTSDEFIAAGRSLPGWVVGLSVFGTFVSSISFLANPGKSFDANWNPFVFSLSLPMAAWIATKWFVPFYRTLGTVSAYDHLESRFGLWARLYAVCCYLLTQVGRVGSIMFLVAQVLETATGAPIAVIIVATGFLVTLYTLLGGIEAVIWTDALQSVVLTLGIMVTLVVIPMEVPGGVGGILDVAVEHRKFSLGSFGASLGESTFWMVLIYGLFINLQNFGIDQSYVQRYATARTERGAKGSVWLGALLYVPISAFLFLIGTGLFALYQSRPELAPAGGFAAGDRVFAYFIVHQLPAGLTGLLMAAIFSAAMSSVDSSLNSAATLTLCDFYRRLSKRPIGEQESMRILHWATIFWGCVGTGAALAMIGVKSVLDLWWSIASIASGGMLGLFLLGMLSRRAGSREALWGTLSGLLPILWITWTSLNHKLPMGYRLREDLRFPGHSNLAIVVGTMAILFVGWGLSRRRPLRSES
ncbi:MAG: sodium:solute symporter [Planctomycetaceae bacterium]